jgi:glycosyltransferase involved in cell wall biosynthesis
MSGTELPRPIRILHIVGGMDRGGVETWLMHVLRHIDHERFQMDFMVHTGTPCAYDQEIRALGGRILPCLGHKRPWSYAKNFLRILGEYGPYDIVHSHVYHYSGYTLLLAKRGGVRVRIAHSHIDTLAEDASPGLLRWIYLVAAKQWIRRFATICLASSGKAAAALFGSSWKHDQRCRSLYCGIDLTPFKAHADPSTRTFLRLPSNAFVIGHVGRFDEQKNHRFLLKIFRRVADEDRSARLLLIGDGPLRTEIVRLTAELGLTGSVVFAGIQANVPRLLLGAVDVFVMPSFYEGLPLAGIEALAAGLPCVMSDQITCELDILPQLIRRLPLSAPAHVWADSVRAARQLRAVLSRAQVLKILEDSPFHIANSVTHLQRIYCDHALPSLPLR